MESALIPKLSRTKTFKESWNAVLKIAITAGSLPHLPRSKFSKWNNVLIHLHCGTGRGTIKRNVCIPRLEQTESTQILFKKTRMHFWGQKFHRRTKFSSPLKSGLNNQWKSNVKYKLLGPWVTVILLFQPLPNARSKGRVFYKKK